MKEQVGTCQLGTCR